MIQKTWFPSKSLNKSICIFQKVHMGVSKNSGTPKSSILIGFSIINHPFWGFSPYFCKHPYFPMCFVYLKPVFFSKIRPNSRKGHLRVPGRLKFNFIHSSSKWVFPKIGGFYPQNGWSIMENPIKMDDLGGFLPIFGSTPNLTWGNVRSNHSKSSKSAPAKIITFTIVVLLGYNPLKTNECPLKINGWFRCIPYWNSPFLGDIR